MSDARPPPSIEQGSRNKKTTLFGRNKNARMKRLLKRAGNLDASRRTNTLRMRTNAVLLTGGLLVRKEGFLWMKKDGLSMLYHKKHVILEEGVLKIFDGPKIPGRKKKHKTATRLIISSDQRRAMVERDKNAEYLIELGQLKSIMYNKRMGKQFEFTWRRSGSKENVRKSIKSRTSLLDKNGNEAGSHHSKTSRFSRLSKALVVTGRNREGTMRGHNNHFSLLNPKTWLSSQERTFQFKAPNGKEGDIWVQSLLYEIKNQAVCIGEAIQGQETMPHLPDPSRLDNLYRQQVDLWALAKGKISLKTKEALSNFVHFLEREVNKNNQDQEEQDDILSFGSFGDELSIWKDMLANISDLVDVGVNTVETGHEVKTGLEELQILNEEQYHSKEASVREVPRFQATTKVLNPGNQFVVGPSGSSGFLRKTMRKTRRTSKGDSGLELKDIVMLTPESRQRTVEVENTFPSAVDVRRKKEHQEEVKILANLGKDEESLTQLQKLTKASDSDE